MAQFLYTYLSGALTLLSVVIITGALVVACWAAAAFIFQSLLLVGRKMPDLPNRVWEARIKTINVHQKKGKPDDKKLVAGIRSVARLGNKLPKDAVSSSAGAGSR